MKKQIFSLFLSILMVASLAACGSSSGSSSQTEARQSGQISPAEAAGQPPAQSGQEPPPGQPPAQPSEPYELVELDVSSDAIDAIMASYSGKSFKEGAVPDDVLEAILQSGQKAPSATNAQPWHFTAIKNSEIAAQLASRNYVEGAVVIVVSGKPDEKVGVNVAFDCALATQNMYIAAQSLGLGAHLYYGGVQNINDSMKESLGIPDGYEAQIIMLVGYLDDSVDAVTSASARNPLSGNVNYIE